MLGSLQQVMGQAPPFSAELDVLRLELHAKRLTVQAQQAELSAFDQQLDALENPGSDGELDTSVDPVAPVADRDSPLGRTSTGIAGRLTGSAVRDQRPALAGTAVAWSTPLPLRLAAR